MALSTLTRGSEQTADFEGALYKRRSDFVLGAILSNSDEVLLWPSDSGGDGFYYQWLGAFPKNVPAGSTPANSGGVSATGWVAVPASGMIARVGNIEDLKRVNPRSSGAVQTLGYYSAGDGGDGLYRYDVSDTTTAGNNGTVVVGLFGSRWKLVPSGQINVRQFGARGNGVSDDTAALQAAFNWASTVSSYLRAPAGIYRTTTTLKILNSFRLVGDGFDTGYRRTMGAQTRYGTYFYFDHSLRGIEQTNATTGRTNTNCMTMRDFATIRNQPTPTNASFTPINHTWDIYMAGYGACEIDNVCPLNATRGIYCEQRAILNSIKGQSFGSFIQIDNNFDVVHITNCHQWPYWDESIFAMDYTRANTISYAFYRCDNAIVSDNFSYAHRYGLQMALGTQGVPSRLKVSNLDLDGGTFGIINTAPGSSAMFSQVSCTSWDGVAVGNGVFASAIGSTMQFDGLMLSNIPEQGIYVEGNNCVVRVSNLWVEGWNKRNTAKPAIACVAPAVFISTDEIRCLRSSGNNADILSGTGTFRVPLGKGLCSAVTSNESGQVVVNHGLIAMPWQIFLTLYERGTIAVRVSDYNATTFTVELFNPATGAVVPNRLFAFSWSAEYYLPIDVGV